MKAVVYDHHGSADVLGVREVPVPSPGRGQVVVRVRAAALNPKDVLLRKGKFRWLNPSRPPYRVAYDWAGEVVALGPGARGVAAGDELFGMINAWEAGAAAEFAAVDLSECAPMPAGTTFEEAAALPLAAQTALQALRDRGGLPLPNARVCINGASGGVGVFAIQIAKSLGARVTTVSSGKNLDFCRSLGADETLDYDRDDPCEKGRDYHVFFDVFGNLGFARARPSLGPGGVFVSAVPSPRVLADALRTVLGPVHARLVVVRSRRADLLHIKELVERGALRPVIDRVLPMAEVQEAQRFIETKRARGKVVLRVATNED
jgi:NADPH:quinone reductase-like Zn-dependent oxidoreductase